MTRDELVQFLAQTIEAGASDVFVIAGLPITLRIDGRQVRLRTDLMTPDRTEEMTRAFYELAGRDYAIFESERNLDDDFSFSVPGVGRFRLNVFRQRGSVGSVLRVIPFNLPKPEQLRIPDEVMRIADFKKGLVLVTGPAGCGKSTTLACLVDKLNHQRHGHIITMEDPIEFVHKHEQCIVTQREIPTDVATYPEALRSATREAPDILMIGEMRDQTTMSAAVTAAETAQLVLSTLHTMTAANAVERIVDAFPPNQQQQIRVQLSIAIQAIVSQQLIPMEDGAVVPAFEVMIATPAIRNLIRESKTHQIDSIISSGSSAGMISMDQSLYKLVEEGAISAEEALAHSIHTEALQKRLDALKQQL